MDDEDLHFIKQWDHPFIILGSHSCTEPVYAVSVDYYSVGKMAVQYLADLGHQHISLLTLPPVFEYQKDIQNGFLSAMQERGIESVGNLVGSLSDSSIGKILTLNPPITAIIVGEPEFAPSVYEIS